MYIKYGTYPKMLIYILLVSAVPLGKSLMLRLENNKQDRSNQLFFQPNYFSKVQSPFSTTYPTFFIDSNAKNPLQTDKRFGFNVIYGTPTNFDTSHPHLNIFKENKNNNFNVKEQNFSKPKDLFFFRKNNDFKEISFTKNGNPYRDKISSYPNYLNSESPSHSNNKNMNLLRKTNQFVNQVEPSAPTSYANNFQFHPSMNNRKEDNYNPTTYGRTLSSKRMDSYPSIQSKKKKFKIKTNLEKSYKNKGNNFKRKILAIKAKDQFRPSPPDIYLNSQNMFKDYTADHSKIIPKYYKFENSNVTKKFNSHNCVGNNKTIEVKGKKLEKVILVCYICSDFDAGARYEECINEEKPKLHSYVKHYNFEEVPNLESNKRINVTLVKTKGKHHSREKRQLDYYEPDSYDSYEGNYRFGPEHFADDEYFSGESSYESDDPNEKCWKRRKGDMLCIACEDLHSGGTYEQCSYASDPGSDSNEYSSPILPSNGGKHTLPQPLYNRPSYSPVYHQETTYPSDHHKTTPQSNGYRYPIEPIPPNDTPYYKKEYYPASSSLNSHNEPRFKNPFNKYRSNDNQRKFRSNFRSNSQPVNYQGSFNEHYDEPELEGNPAALSDHKERQYSINQAPKTARNSSPAQLNFNNNGKKYLEELSYENKSECKKILRNKMMCYQCVDEKGFKSESCNYVNSSPLKINKVAQQKISKNNSTPIHNEDTVSTKVIIRPGIRLVNTRGKYVPITTFRIQDSQLMYPNVNQIRKREKLGSIRYSRRSDDQNTVGNNLNLEIPTKELSKSNDNVSQNTTEIESNKFTTEDEINKDKSDTNNKNKYNSIPPDPPELREKPPNSKGKFSKETKLVFDPLLGISLPKYMVEKSEHESMFDEILTSG